MDHSVDFMAAVKAVTHGQLFSARAVRAENNCPCVTAFTVTCVARAVIDGRQREPSDIKILSDLLTYLFTSLTSCLCAPLYKVIFLIRVNFNLYC